MTGWLERFEIEHNNFRKALEWLTATGDAEWGLRLGAALFRFWEAREYLAEGRTLLEKVLKLPGAGAATNGRLRALSAAGILAAAQGDSDASKELFTESLEIARQVDDKRSIAVSVNALAINARDRGELAASRARFEESLRLWREMGDGLAVARALSNLANVVKLLGAYEEARALYRESLGIFRQLGDRTGAAWALNHEGAAASDQGDCAAARALYEESLENFRGLGDDGGSRVRWRIWGIWRGRKKIMVGRRRCTGKASRYSRS